MLFQAVFEANVAAMHGGGLYLDNGAALTVREGMGDRFFGEGQWQRRQCCRKDIPTFV